MKNNLCKFSGNNKYQHLLLLIHSIYFLGTGFWPLLWIRQCDVMDRQSSEKFTSIFCIRRFQCSVVCVSMSALGCVSALGCAGGGACHDVMGQGLPPSQEGSAEKDILWNDTSPSHIYRFSHLCNQIIVVRSDYVKLIPIVWRQATCCSWNWIFKHCEKHWCIEKEDNYVKTLHWYYLPKKTQTWTCQTGLVTRGGSILHMWWGVVPIYFWKFLETPPPPPAPDPSLATEVSLVQGLLLL